MPPDLAITKSVDLGLDLVEVSPDSRPPVCRIMDYGKYKYEQKKKVGEAKKHQTNVAIKEVKFRPKIEEHDYQTKMGNLKRFLGEGHKVKVTMMFRGRELTRPEMARRIMDRVRGGVEGMGAVESLPRLEGRNMTMVIAPNKVKARVEEQHGQV